VICPRCGSTATRRGGRRTWLTFALLIALVIPGVLLAHIPAAVAGAALLVLVLVTHLILRERHCTACGAQWSGDGSSAG
jgi:hypothetical protein